MRRKVIAGNWKLNKTIKEAIDFTTLLKRESLNDESPEVIICPVFTALSETAETCQGTNIAVGAQDLYWEESGAFTGEVSASLIKDTGASHAIVGHSERRQFFSETDETVNSKTKAALANGLYPIVCCGETLEERESNKTFDVLTTQIQGAFKDIDSNQALNCLVAYEPVWAIGTGKVATAEQAEEAHAHIRKLLAEIFGQEIADQIRILYGGSVKPDNAGEILKMPNVDGALVGGASLKADSFIQIIQSACNVGV